MFHILEFQTMNKTIFSQIISPVFKNKNELKYV